MSGAPIPVYVISGFLGSGKTTLLNAVLKFPQLASSAIIINEFGQTGLDHLFVEGREDAIIELSNGCLCCTIRGELAQTLESLPLAGIDRVIVETTGLADPVPVLQAILSFANASRRFALAGLVVLADALNAPDQLARQPEARMQIVLADLILVSKLDMVPQEQRQQRLAQLTASFRALNQTAPIAQSSDIAPSRFLAAGSGGRKPAVFPGDHAWHNHQHDVSRHGDLIRSLVLHWQKPLPFAAIAMFCELLTSAHAAHLLRLKGIIAIEGEARPLVVHAIHGVLHEPSFMPQWPDTDHATRIVVILRDLDPEFVERLFYGFANRPMVDTPDRQALLNNPLAPPGTRLG